MEEKKEDFWKRKYSMTENDWSSEWFQNIIGGKNVTEQEKEKNLKRIKKAIEENKKGEVKKINKDTFVNSYPDSIILLKEYYDSIINALHKKGTKYRNYNYFDVGNNVTWEEVLIKDRNAMLMIYAPFLSRLTKDKQDRYARYFGLTYEDLSNMLKKHRNSIYSNKKNKTDDKKKELEVLKTITKDISENHLTRQEVEEKYKIDTDTFTNYMTQLKKIDTKTYNTIINQLNENDTYKQEINDILKPLHDYIKDGIEVDDKKISFTMLDYYSLYKCNPKEITGYIHKNKDNTDVNQNRGRILGFFSKNKDVGLFQSPETFAKRKVSFIINGQKIDFDEEKSSEIINILKENSIPANFRIVYKAAERYATGQDLFPAQKSIKTKKR